METDDVMTEEEILLFSQVSWGGMRGMLLLPSSELLRLELLEQMNLTLHLKQRQWL